MLLTFEPFWIVIVLYYEDVETVNGPGVICFLPSARPSACPSRLRVTMVHFRCSDTPFVRKSGHLQHKGYWEFVAAQIVAQGGGKRVVFTLCTM